MWKLICGDGAAESYLGYLADAATDLLTGSAEEDEGQWRECHGRKPAELGSVCNSLFGDQEKLWNMYSLMKKTAKK